MCRVGRADVQLRRTAQLKNWSTRFRGSVTFATARADPKACSGQEGVRGAGARRQVPEHAGDTQVPYLKTVFTFLGLTDVHFVYAEGLSMGPDAEQQGIASAYEQIEEAVAA